MTTQLAPTPNPTRILIQSRTDGVVSNVRPFEWTVQAMLVVDGPWLDVDFGMARDVCGAAAAAQEAMAGWKEEQRRAVLSGERRDFR